MLYDTGVKPGDFDGIEGDVNLLKAVEMVDQNPIGKSTRSNPVTYIKAYDEIRKLFADQPYAQHTGLNATHFSFNVAGGRCEECQGEGVIKVSMQFMADVELVCEACGGKRFRDEVLEVKYRDKNISEVLDMTVDDAIVFFSEEQKTNPTCRRIVDRLRPLQDVGLGYIRLGQSSSTLSGGESQRVKLASFLTKESVGSSVLFIFDEPTTGTAFPRHIETIGGVPSADRTRTHHRRRRTQHGYHQMRRLGGRPRTRSGPRRRSHRLRGYTARTGTMPRELHGQIPANARKTVKKVAEFHTYTLPNGIRGIHRQVKNTVAHCALVINAGSRDEYPDQYGLAHFVEHAFSRAPNDVAHGRSTAGWRTSAAN